MASEKVSAAEQQKRTLTEKLWMTYFTQYLFQHNMLTESDRNRILLKIDHRKGSTYGKKVNEIL